MIGSSLLGGAPEVTPGWLTTQWTNCNIPASAVGMEFDEDLDAIGLLCPLPVLKAAKRMRALAPGQVLRLRADDPAAIVDVPNYCRESGNDHLALEEAEGVQLHFIRKSG